jgi:hypothetical protein
MSASVSVSSSEGERHYSPVAPQTASDMLRDPTAPPDEQGMVPAGISVQRAGHGGVYDLVGHLCRPRGRVRGGSGVQLAIVRTQSRAFSLSMIPGKCRRNSTTADNSPPAS